MRFTKIKIHFRTSLREEIKNALPVGKASFMAERNGFEPLIQFWGIHDLQSCALDQLGHLSTDFYIIAERFSIVKCFFRFFCTFFCIFGNSLGGKYRTATMGDIITAYCVRFPYKFHRSRHNKCTGVRNEE